MKNNNGNSQNDSESSFFRRFEEQFKKFFFGLFVNVMKEEEPSIVLFTLLYTITYLQALYYTFHQQLLGSWAWPNISENIEMILSYLHIQAHLTNVSWNGYIILFYTVIGYMTIIIVMSVIISISAQQQQHFGWPLPFLKWNYLFLASFLYMPVFQMLFSIYTCKNVDGIDVFFYFEDVQCWESMHLIHFSIGTFIMLISLLFISFSTLTCYEARQLSQDMTSRRTSRSIFYFQVYVFIKIALFAVLRDMKYNYLLSIYMTAGSAMIYYVFSTQFIFYQKSINQSFVVLNGVLIYSNILLLFALILEESFLEGIVIIWLITIPMLVVIISLNEFDRTHIFMWHPQQLSSEEQVCQYAGMLQELEINQADKRVRLLLQSFISVHLQICTLPDCYLQLAIDQNNKSKKYRGKNNDIEQLNWDGHINIYGKIFQIYNFGIKKFPQSSRIRVEFSVFLLRNPKSKQQALQELVQAEQLNPPFDVQFIIYRYKQVIEDEISNSQSDDTMDIVSELAFQAFLRSFQSTIERVAIMHMEFWQQLREDYPDLGQMYELGVKINVSAQGIQDQWKRLQKMSATSSNVNAAYRLYGKFLLQIVNDEVEGQILLNKARDAHIANQNKLAQVFTSLEELSNESTASIVVSTDEDQLGQIAAVNLSACNLFGYSKLELLGRKVNSIMPQMIGEVHDQFLLNFLERPPDQQIKKERQVISMNQNHYLFPSYLKLRTLQFSTDTSVSIIAGIRVDQYFRLLHYFLVDKEGNIEYMSANCIPVLRVDNSWISGKKKRHLDKIFPGLFDKVNSQDFKPSMKTGINVDLKLPDTKNQDQYQVKSNRLAPEIQTDRIPVHLYISEFNYSASNIQMGWICRFEVINNSPVETLNVSQQQINHQSFQFTYNRNTGMYKGQFSDQSNSEIGSVIESNIDAMNNTSSLIGGLSAQQNEEKERSNNKKITHIQGFHEVDNYREISINVNSPNNNEESKKNSKDVAPSQQVIQKKFGADIKIFRLDNDGMVRDITDEENSDSQEDMDSISRQNSVSKNPNSAQQQAHQDDDEEQDDQMGEYGERQNQRLIKAVIRDKKEPKAIKILKYGVNVVVLIFLAYALIQYFIVSSSLGKVDSHLTVIRLSGNRMAQVSHILSNVRDLKFLKVGIFNLTLVQKQKGLFFDYELHQDELQMELKRFITELEAIQRNITLDGPVSSSEQTKLIYEKTIKMGFKDQNSAFYDIQDATEQYINYAFQISGLTMDELGVDQMDTVFVQYNMFNDYFDAIQESYQIYIKDFQNINEDQTLMLTQFLIISMVIHFLAMLFILIIVSLVIQNIQEILTLYLDIPAGNIKTLHSKCEAFIANLQMGEQDEEISLGELDHLIGQDESEISSYVKRKRKKYKNSTMSNRGIYLVMLAAFCTIVAYYIQNFVLGKEILTQMHDMIQEYNLTCLAESYYVETTNVHHQMMFDPNYPLNFHTDTLAYSSEMMQNTYSVDSDMHSLFSSNEGTHSAAYVNTYQSLIMENACDIFFNIRAVSQEDCQYFSNGTITEGMGLALTKYFEYTKSILTLYQIFVEEPDTPFQKIVPKEGFFIQTLSKTDTRLNKAAGLLDSSSAQENREFEKVYLQPGMRYLSDKFQIDLTTIYDSHLLIRLIVLIAFLVLFFVGYVMGWLPYLGKQSRDLYRTRAMLGMIPINIITSIKSVRVFLQQYVNQYDVDEDI